MKDFFKKNPEFLYILIAVLVIDGVIIWFCMGDNAATAKKQQELENLRNQANSINGSKFQTNPGNADKARKNAETVVKEFDDKFKKKLEQYKYKKTAQETFTSKPRALTNYRDLLDDLSKKLKDQDKTGEAKFSFNEYQDQILQMEIDKIQVVFEILNGFMKIADNCLKADIESINEVERPMELTFLTDKELGIKTYSYTLKLSGNGGSIKRLINLISSDKEYFFEISSIKLLAQKQIETEGGAVKPLIDRGNAGTGETPGGTPGGPGGELEELERGLGPGPGAGTGPGTEEGEVTISKESVQPFTSAVNDVELIIDWIQFIDTNAAAPKKKGKGK